MKNTVVIEDIRRWGERGWSWTRRYTDESGQEGLTCHRTNGDGEGLFARDWHENAWRQSHGTMQYSMPGTEAGLRARLRAMYADLGEVTFKD